MKKDFKEYIDKAWNEYEITFLIRPLIPPIGQYRFAATILNVYKNNGITEKNWWNEIRESIAETEDKAANKNLEKFKNYAKEKKK